MLAGSRNSIAKGVLLAAVAALGTILSPGTAEAQARGTLQATARVVATQPSLDALRAARSAIEGRLAVATVAQVSVARPSARPATLVVTIDYARN